MTNVKLSQIAPSPSNVAATTQFVAVEGGNTDLLFSPSQFINGFNLLRATIADQVLSGGWNVIAHNYATGTVTIDCGLSPLQTITNNGTFTIIAPGNDGQTLLQITNGAAAGTVTFSGFQTGDTGDLLTTTNGQIFSVLIWRVNGVSQYYVIAANSPGGVGGAPFLSTVSSTTYSPTAPSTPDVATARGNANRWSDVINVLDFGADPTGAADSTIAIQAAVNAFTVSGTAASRGRIYIPPGQYKVSQSSVTPGAPAIQLPRSTTGSASPSIIIEGGGLSGSTGIFASPAFNGFIFDDVSLTTINTQSANSVWEVGGLFISNPYTPAPIYKGFKAAAAWAFNAPTIVITNSTLPASGIQAGAILFSSASTGTFGSAGGGGGGVPGLIGVVQTVATGVPSGTQTTLTLVSGAAIPSFGATDGIQAVQGFFAGGTFSTASITVPMNAVVPSGAQTLDPGYYYVWDWQKVTANANPIPQCLGVVLLPSGWTNGGATASTITLNGNNNSNVTSTLATNPGDLLVLSPISGGIRHFAGYPATVHNCVVKGVIGITADSSNITLADRGNVNTYPFHFAVRDTVVTNPFATVVTGADAQGNASWAIGQHGIIAAQSGIVENVDASGCWVGARLYGFNPYLVAGRQESCCYGIVLGGICHDAGGSTTAVNGFSILDTEAEASWGAAVLTDGATAATGFISGMFGQANHNNHCYGLYIKSGGQITISSCTFSGGVGSNFGSYWNPSLRGPGTPAAIYVDTTSNNPGQITFISTTANNNPGLFSIQQGLPTPAWHLPATFPTFARFINCNNPPAIYTFAQLPTATTVTGQIDNAGPIQTPPVGTGSGNILQLTSGSLARTAIVGSLVIGTGVPTNTILTGNQIQTTGAGSANRGQVSNSANTGSISITIYPMVDGDEYLISDSPIPYQPLFTASAGAITTGSATIAMTTTAPSYTASLPGLSVIDTTIGKTIGVVSSYSSTTLTLVGNAAFNGTAGSDVLAIVPLSAGLFVPPSNVGTPIIAGGGAYKVKVRWSAALLNWIIV